MRIIRILKILNMQHYNLGVTKLFHKLKIPKSFSRILKLIAMSFFSVHLISCFFHMASSFKDYAPDTWVAKKNYQDRKWNQLYLLSFYWAFQTLTTVGYGDFGAYNHYEIWLTVFWMMFGVIFYASVVGTLTSVITEEVLNAEGLSTQLAALD